MVPPLYKMPHHQDSRHAERGKNVAKRCDNLRGWRSSTETKRLSFIRNMHETRLNQNCRASDHDYADVMRVVQLCSEESVEGFAGDI